MSDEQTCGKGLAEHSVIPMKIAAFLGALAKNLERHLPTLDLSDGNSRKEHAAYQSLAEGYRRSASELDEVAKEMAGYRDLPMGRHVERAMSGRDLIDAFEKFVQTERELVKSLTQQIQRDDAMLAAMRGDSP